MTITVLGEEKKIACPAGSTLLTALSAAGVYVSAPCGGKGRCGKCAVRVSEGAWEPTPEDRVHFSKEALEQGFRLACMGRPQTDCTVALVQPDEEVFAVLADVEEAAPEAGDDSRKDADGTAYFFAIDIGTTTLAISLAEEESGRMRDTWTGINHQRAFGADVISRIRACDEGKEETLTASIKNDLLAGMKALLARCKVPGDRIAKVVIAGNTTMGHLLLGYDCHGLGQMPFTPVNIDTVTVPFSALFGEPLLACPVTVMPGFSAYVGGDIVSGLLCTKFDEREKPSLFIDLGTNGEMAIGNKDRLLVTSTAAGPAFEGGNLTCGVGSIDGAICGVQIENENPVIKTIGGKPPIGVCGTGVIEAIAALLDAELLEDSGLLDEDYFDDGYVLAQTADGADIAITQKDIRELQLAKAAVRAGLETLLLRYGIGYADLEHVYVAGGFGVHLDMSRAAAIGLLPAALADKVTAAGNTSLGGAICYGTDADAAARCAQLIQHAKEVDLSTDKDFQEFYMDAMFFGDEDL